MVTGMEDPDASRTRLRETLGPAAPTVDGSCFDVRPEIAPTNLAFAARAPETPTDLPSEEAAPGVQLLHGRADTGEGGPSLFVDVAAVAEAPRPEDRAAFDLLASHDLPFFDRHEVWDHRSHRPAIDLDQVGAVSGVTVSRHLGDSLDLPQRLLDDWCPAFRRFLMMEDRSVNRFRPGGGHLRGVRPPRRARARDVLGRGRRAPPARRSRRSRRAAQHLPHPLRAYGRVQTGPRGPAGDIAAPSARVGGIRQTTSTERARPRGPKARSGHENREHP